MMLTARISNIKSEVNVTTKKTWNSISLDKIVCTVLLYQKCRAWI